MNKDDVLVDPVLRLAYDYYGEDGVQLIKRIQQQRREQKNRKGVVLDIEDDEEDDEEEMNFYDRVERLLETNPNLAREELQRFFKQHDYHKSLMEGNQVQLACNLEFPPVLNLKKLVYQGRDYIQYVRKSSYAAAQNVSEEEREYYARRIKQEQSLVDYQLNRFRDSQKTSVGFTLSSSVPTRGSVTMTGGTPLRPKWSMAMGGTSNLAFPEVAEVLKLAGKEETDSRHPTSMFINAVYQPVPETQINFTTNLSNNQSHQVRKEQTPISFVNYHHISYVWLRYFAVCGWLFPYTFKSFFSSLQFDLPFEIFSRHKSYHEFEINPAYQRFWFVICWNISRWKRKATSVECKLGELPRDFNNT